MSGLKKKGTDTNTSKEQNKSNVSTHHKTEECVNYDAKNKNLGHNGAYQLAQKIKNETLKYGTLQKLDLSGNHLQDEGIIYISISIKSLCYMESLNVSNNNITEYGFRMLLEALKYTSLKQLDISYNPLGTKGAEYLAKSLSSAQITPISLNAHSCQFGVDGGKILGVTLSNNTTIKKLDLSKNNIKGSGAILVMRGITTNNTLETVNLSYNNFGAQGTQALSDLIKLNTVIKTLSLNSCYLQLEADSKLPEAFSFNSSLKKLHMDDNTIQPNRIFDILDNLNSKKSQLELLNIKSVQVPRCTSVMIELIQQKRPFTCIHGQSIMASSLEDNFYDVNPLIKLANNLSNKNMSLLDLLRIINPSDDPKHSIDKYEFSRRLRMFDQRLSQKEIDIITEKLLTSGDKITYSSLVKQRSSEKMLSEEALLTKKKQLDKRNPINTPIDMNTAPTKRGSYLTDSKELYKKHNLKSANNNANLTKMMNSNNRHIGCLNTDINYFDTSYLELNKRKKLSYVDKWLENDTLRQNGEIEEPKVKTNKIVKLPPSPSSKSSSPRKSMQFNSTLNSSSGYGASREQSPASSLLTNKQMPPTRPILKSFGLSSSANGKTPLPSLNMTGSQSSVLNNTEVRRVSIKLTDQSDIFGNTVKSADPKIGTRENTTEISPPPNMREYKPIKSY